jgi:hypothetical protein
MKQIKRPAISMNTNIAHLLFENQLQKALSCPLEQAALLSTEAKTCPFIAEIKTGF